MTLSKKLVSLLMLALLSACADASVISIMDKDERYRSVVSETGVGVEGGPIMKCMTTFDTQNKNAVVHDGCAAYRGTAQGGVEAGAPALIGAGAMLGSAGIIRSGMDEIPAAETNVTVENKASAGGKSSYNYKRKRDYNHRGPSQKGWGHVR